MTTSQKAPMRPRRKNGHRRNSRVYSVRDLNPHTEARIDKLAGSLRLRRGEVLDRAVQLLFEQAFPNEGNHKAETVSTEDMSWIKRPGERLSPKDCPEIAELDRKQEERRRRRDAIMGRAA